MIRSANPALKGDIFAAEGRGVGFGQETMTVQGTVSKALVLMALVAIAGAFTWQQAAAGASDVSLYTGIGAIGGFIMAMVTIFKRTWAPVTAPIYAVLEGLALGGISLMFEARFPGIAMQAVGLTAAVFTGMFLAYKTGFVQATDGFRRGIMAATGGIALLYLVEMVMNMFGAHVPYIHDSGPIGLGVSVVISAVAALNLVIDFDIIEQGARARAPKYMEWYGAFSLLVTLVWLYMELLRLLSKMRDRN